MNKPCFIVAGGPSVTDEQLKMLNDHKYMSDKIIIAVNKTLLHLTFPHYFITMDYTFLSKIEDEIIYLENTLATRVFVVNFAQECIKENSGRIYDVRTMLHYNLALFDIVVKSRLETGFGTSWQGFVSGKNSGFCALQFAALMGFNPIYLFGVDLISEDQTTHFHGGYGEPAPYFISKLKEYRTLWTIGLRDLKRSFPDLEVYSCSPVSVLNNLIPFKQLKGVI